MAPSEFCPDDLYNEDIVWNTDNPNFTQCFRETILAACPLAVLFLSLAVKLMVAFCKPGTVWKGKNYQWDGINLLFFLKLISLVLLMANQISDLINKGISLGWERMHASTHLGFSLWFSSYILAVILTLIDKLHAKHSSAPLFLYWLTATLAAVPTFKVQVEDLINTGNKKWEDIILATTFFPFIVIELFLHCWPDLGGYKPQGKEPPETTASFLSQMAFSWFDKLIWQGYRTPLTQEDLPDSPHSVDVQSNVSVFRANWLKKVHSLHVDFTTKGEKRPMISIWPIMLRTYAL